MGGSSQLLSFPAPVRTIRYCNPYILLFGKPPPIARLACSTTPSASLPQPRHSQATLSIRLLLPGHAGCLTPSSAKRSPRTIIIAASRLIIAWVRTTFWTCATHRPGYFPTRCASPSSLTSPPFRYGGETLPLVRITTLNLTYSKLLNNQIPDHDM